MSIDKPRRPAQNVPYIDESEPPPAPHEREERWTDPYLSDRIGMWTAFTRRPLSYREVTAGLESYVRRVAPGNLTPRPPQNRA